MQKNDNKLLGLASCFSLHNYQKTRLGHCLIVSGKGITRKFTCQCDSDSTYHKVGEVNHRPRWLHLLHCFKYEGRKLSSTNTLNELQYCIIKNQLRHTHENQAFLCLQCTRYIACTFLQHTLYSCFLKQKMLARTGMHQN